MHVRGKVLDVDVVENAIEIKTYYDFPILQLIQKAADFGDFETIK